MSKLKGKIFVIDDDVYIGDMLEEALQKAGYEVSRAYSGTEALLFLEKEILVAGHSQRMHRNRVYD